MPEYTFGNFFATELTVGATVGTTILQVPPSATLQLPLFDVPDGKEARLTLWDGQLPPEIVGCIKNVQDGNLTVVRGKEGTTPQAWAAGTQIVSTLSAEVINAALAAYFDFNEVLGASFLKLSGGVLTGPLILHGDPTVALGAVTKQYADTVIGTGLPLSGGTMQGDINMNGNAIVNLPAPAGGSSPATKTYVDNLLASPTDILNDFEGSLVSGGTASAYTVTTNDQPGSYINGWRLCIKFGAANAAGATLNADALGARPLRVRPGVAIPAGRFVAGVPQSVVFDAVDNAWIVAEEGAPIWTGQTVEALGTAAFFTGLRSTLALDDATLGPIHELYRDSATPAAADLLGSVDYYGKNGSNVKTLYGRHFSSIVDPTNASEDGAWTLQVVSAGGLVNVIAATAAGISIPGLTVGGNPVTGALSTRQVLTAGSGATYSTPPGARQLRIAMIGGGGGGGARITNPGVAGTATIFNSIEAAGGGGGAVQFGPAGAGGSGGAGAASIRRDGNDGHCTSLGGSTTTDIYNGSGGNGGAGIFGMSAARGGNPDNAGTNAQANSGAGGGGAGGNSATESNQTGSAGGGSGEYVELIINNPAASYIYTVGNGGAGGAAGGLAGGNGGSGVIIVDEYY